MTDEQIVKAVREGTHTLVPMPVGERKFYIGAYGNADVQPNDFVLILDLNADQFEGEEIVGHMMGDLTRHASDCSLHNEPALPAGPCDCKHDDEIAF